jgi:hypothetical protein
VRRLLAALLVVAAGCSNGPAPAPIPAPPPELAVLQVADKGYAIVETRTGKVRAMLPGGILAIGLSGGGDIDEGYLVASSAAQGTAIARLVPERSFALEPLATQAGVAAAAVLAPAPGLTSFVSPPTVLVVLSTDGRLSGYQHGRLIWSGDGSTGRQLEAFGHETLVLSSLGWQRLTVETGSVGPVEAAPACRPDPMAAVSGKVVYDCAGGPAAWTLPPVLSPDGSVIYVADPGGVERMSSSSGTPRRLVKASGISSIALSRDGNYLYALAAGRLHTYSTASGSEVGSVPAEGDLILKVAGG